jgi:alpha-L-fucosidase
MGNQQDDILVRISYACAGISTEENIMPQMPLPTPGDTSWFSHDRFGLFIHWGLYALPARHEWIKSREQITEQDYDTYFKHFDPDLYDPGVWAREARNAGMKYFVVTTKHHDGFCLFDSKLTDYSASHTPYGKDLIKPMVDAFRAEEMKVGFYHSLIDWHHPEFPIDIFHPMRDRDDVEAINSKRNMNRYVEYLHGQSRELLTQYGKVDIMWFDFSYPNADYRGLPGKGRHDWQSKRLYSMVRDAMPDVVLNDRMNLEEGWDIKTPEQYQPSEWLQVDGKPVLWEACQTFSGSWGYHRDEQTWKSTEPPPRREIDTVSKGGNLLLNVGPTGRGEFDARAIDRLRGMGRWMHHNSRSIYGCSASDYVAPSDCRYTQNGKRLYLHIFAWPFKHIQLDDLAGKVAYAQFLHDASEVRYREFDAAAEVQRSKEGQITLSLPVIKPDVTIPVIELFLK